MVKRKVMGVTVPDTATTEELLTFVHSVHAAYDSSYLRASEALGVTPATVWKMVNGEQRESHVIRKSMRIRKTPIRPRVWMPTNNVSAAIDKLVCHYGRNEIVEALISKGLDINVR